MVLNWSGVMQGSDHWENVYRNKPFDTVSWYAPHLDESLRLIQELCPDPAASIIDIGGGESTLVDDLLHCSYLDVSVLDISATAIDFTRQRLGAKAKDVSWYVGNIIQYDFGSKQFDLWHDRAVFHFLTERSDRQAYVELVRRSVKPGGHVLMATFGPDGPLKCSGLDVVRYDDQSLHHEFGEGFQMLGSKLAEHNTPMGIRQQFLYCWCRA
jgi:SAM-dependent methyltransferase